MNNNLTFIDLFAGIGGFHIALTKNGAKCVFTSEWDKEAQKTYHSNFGIMPKGDITEIKESEVPSHDILCAGFPCQAFSISGKQKGFEDTRGTLFFDIARIAKKHKPKVLFLENVKNFVRHDKGQTLNTVINTLNSIGYNTYYNILKSSHYGVPQARERVYMVAFRKDIDQSKDFSFPEASNEIITVKDILQNEKVAKEFFIDRPDMVFHKSEDDIKSPFSPSQIGKINKGGQGERIYSINTVGITLSAYGGGAAAKTGAYLIDGKVRKLTPKECLRMQGFPDSFILPERKNLAYKQLGNSVSIPVIDSIFKKVLLKLQESNTLHLKPKEIETPISL